jgi:hypothetical protein
MSEAFSDDRWEYSLEYITTETYQEQAFLQANFPDKTFPRYAVQASLPRLNAIGEQGWELVQMVPVIIGKNGDVEITAAVEKWTYTYFCVFKRRKA